ncbi:hypothetical protein F5B22DRAFT_143763 [Xylaria bambusicola]|uniref:uncharacterized protein n=1 Tax=Xylaria bambusicola TaxID=326684 RepID=UPI002008CC3E|nr:uncharacterized protein F5B22DRAFT_143763 [Xylaria bambusicola]KAI0517022.1 hypothetical protein F5B22DRAFT_143763 [Xylaria bambusicola]
MLWESIVNTYHFEKSNFLIVFTKTDFLDGYLNDKGIRNFLTSKGVQTTHDEYLDHLESRFRELIRWSEDRDQRVRFVHANLVDALETKWAAMDIMEVLEDFERPRTSQFGTYPAVNRELSELFVKPLVRRNSVNSSCETSSVVAGRLSVRENEDTNALLLDVTQ